MHPPDEDRLWHKAVQNAQDKLSWMCGPGTSTASNPRGLARKRAYPHLTVCWAIFLPCWNSELIQVIPEEHRHQWEASRSCRLVGIPNSWLCLLSNPAAKMYDT
jgi:hypothetical protein